MKNALLISGGWGGHQPKECAALFAPKLAERGFKVEIVETLDVLNDAARLASYSLIVPIWTMGTMTRPQEDNLTNAVLGGVGIAGFHGGMGDAFNGSNLYQWMVGGQFVSHPDGHKDYTINLVKPQDPILAGLSDFKVHTEQYYMLVDPRNEVLATSTFNSTEAPWVNGVVMPVVWKKMHGKGRVFYSALGHDANEFTAIPAQLEITLRGMAWASR